MAKEIKEVGTVAGKRPVLARTLRYLMMDGEWKDLDWLVEQVGDMIPPELGVAVARKSWSHPEGVPWRVLEASGRQAFVLRCLRSLERTGTLERDPERNRFNARYRYFHGLNPKPDR